MKFLIKYMVPYKKEFILGPFFKLIEAILELIIPLIMANVIDIGIQNNNIDYTIKMGIIMLILAAIGFSFSIMCQYYAAKAAGGIGTTLRKAVFSHVNSLAYKDIDKFETTSLVNRVTNDVNQVQFAVNMAIRLVSRSPFLIIGAIIMSMLIDFNVSIVVLIAAPIIALAVYITMKKTAPYYTKIQKQLDDLSIVSIESLSGVRVIRAFSKRNEYKEKFKKGAYNLENTAISVSKFSSFLQPITYLIVNIAIIFIVYIGAKRVNIGSLAQGEIIAIVSYMTQIMLSLVVVANLVIIFTKAYASALRIYDILNIPIEDNNDENLELLKYVEGNTIIEFNNVSFSYYDGGEDELCDISFKVEKGEVIGIIGGTGAGKTTLINLIPKFYDIKNGNIKINGKNIEEYSLKNLRKKIGIVPQKAMLFKGTIADNLRWSKESATNEEMYNALKTARCLDFLKKKLDDKDIQDSSNLSTELDIYVERGGKNFSGGQRQRLTIARAIINKPEVLIMDDSLSALDNITQKDLMDNLSNNISNMTILIVSQRISAIKNADKILVIDDGKIICQGTHEELLKNCKLYMEIYESQK